MQVTNQATEFDLLRDLLSGRPLAYRQIDRHIRKVVGPRFPHLQPADIDDVVQASFLHLYTQVSEPSFRLERSLRGYIRTIAVARAIDLTRRLRTRHRRETADCVDEHPSFALSPLEELITQDQVSRLRAAIDQLDPERKELLRARYLGEASFRELAARSGKPLTRIWEEHLECIQELRKSLLKPEPTPLQRSQAHQSKR